MGRDALGLDNFTRFAVYREIRHLRRRHDNYISKHTYIHTYIPSQCHRVASAEYVLTASTSKYPANTSQSQRDPSEADSPPQPAPSRRRLTQATQLDSDDADSDSRSHSDSGSPPPLTQSTQNVAVKKLVRLALASEYSRQPIRRNDITQKVLGEGSRQFKPVFEEAQKVLRERFGMHMVELPVKEKLTISQRRGALLFLALDSHY